MKGLGGWAKFSNNTSLMEVFVRAKRAAIYTRVSTLDQHPEMQEEELVQYVTHRNWTLHKVKPHVRSLAPTGPGKGKHP
jgi:predicted site-specific integrase-resolvase